MKKLALAAVACMGLSASAYAQESGLYNPSIKHMPKDGVVRFYGAGGPHTAFQKVANAWEKKTGKRVEIVAGPERKWSAKAQADADILWGTSEQSMTAFLETYKTFSSEQVEPIYVRPTIIAVKKGNPKKIERFEDLLKSPTPRAPAPGRTSRDAWGGWMTFVRSAATSSPSARGRVQA